MTADQLARDRIARDVDSTLFVDAGAGSGKTSSLVSRLVTLVCRGVDITSVAAITFTEAAAAELRARVRQELEAIEQGGDVPGFDDSDRLRELAGSALDDLDQAAICTLHAFAQRLLLRFPVQAGLPPRLEIHDDISSVLRFEERWHRFEQKLLEDDDLDLVLRVALAHRVGSDSLRRLATVLGQNWDLVEEAERAGRVERDRARTVDLGVLDAHSWRARGRAILDRRAVCTDAEDKLLGWLDRDLAPWISELEHAGEDRFAVLAQVGGFPKGGGKGTGRAPNWPDDAKPEIVAAVAALRTDVKAAADQIIDDVLTRLGGELAAFTLAEARRRHHDAGLDFHDLLVLARRMLRSDVDVRRQCHDRYRHLLIDEFQDTDPLQVELAVRIAADPDHDPATPWDRVEVEPGRLFFVGDPKQSIYRFRRADIDLYLHTARLHPAGATSLQVNFRTTAPVLGFCNAVFAELIGEGADDGAGRTAQPPYVELLAHREPIVDDPGPPVLVLGADAHERAEDARLAEAADVAAALQRARDEGWQVHHKHQEPRPCTWADMAILLPSRTSLAVLRRALDEAEIPYRIETGTLVYGTTEVNDLLAILRAIDDPGDDVAIVGALRSPAYGCGDDDLRRWMGDGNRLTYLGAQIRDDASRLPDAATGVVEAALADLRARHRDAAFTPVPQLIDALIRERALFAAGLEGGRHRDAWRLYRVVLEHARQFTDNESGGLRAFLHWTELQRDDRIRATSPVLPEADVDAVRILTIHGSKGLEFGITAVSGLSAQDPNGERGAMVLFPPDGGFEVKIRQDLQTVRYQPIRTLEETMDVHERIRLLYVALTRARDHLIVSTHHTSRGRAKSHGGRLAACLDGMESNADIERWTTCADAVDDAVVDVADGSLPAPNGVGAASVDVDPDELERWRRESAVWQRRRAALVEAASGGVLTASSLASRVAADRDGVVDGGTGAAGLPDDDEPRPEPESEPWRRGRAGTSIGSAVHAVLQHADLTDPDGHDLAGLARWQAGVEGVPAAASEIERKARAALASPLVRAAVASGRWWREVHVAVPLAVIDDRAIGGNADLFEGFIDLLFDTDEGLVVVDYKTDAVPSDAAVAAALDRYTPQGAAYALGLEAATGRPVAAVHFLFLRGDTAVDAEVPELPARLADARAAVVRATVADTGGVDTAP